MSNTRRSIDRRRRVLYSSYQAEQEPTTAASRREAERLREAWGPPAAYGSRVHRRLRARWFSLVPVKRRTMILVAGMLAALAMLLTAAHYAAVAWPPIAYHADIARPLRLDRPDSFGRWFMVSLLASSSGASFLIYQLRRYSNDDFSGRYRLWRLVLIVTLLASVHSLVSLTDWLGGLLDLTFGERVALRGSDWIRLVVSIGGAILALRLVAEVRRCRSSLGMLFVACGLFAIPEAAKWSVLEVTTIGRWTMVTSAPMLGCTTLFIAFGAYLRMLYREVRQIEENASLRDRLQQIRLNLFQRDEDDREREPKPSPKKPRRNQRSASASEESGGGEPEETTATNTRPAETSPQKGWFRNRRKPTKETQESAEHEQPAADVDDSAQEPERKRRRFSLRLAPQTSKPRERPRERARERATEEVKETSSEAAEKPKRGLGGWLKGKRHADASEASDPDAAKTSVAAKNEPAAAEQTDPDEIDWGSLSKSERRRLRKQLKRQNRAA